jgi:capsid protein
MLYRVAAGLGVTAEALTGDLSQVNFSSGRLGWQEFGRSIDAWRWQMFIPTFCAGVARWFSDVTGITGAPTWTPPARTLIDPTREVPAIRDAVRAGLMSLAEAQREQGYDPTTLLEEIAQTNAQLDAMGIRLDSDPRVDKPAAQAAETNNEDDENA